MAQSHKLNLASQGTSLKALFSGYLMVVAVGYLMAIVQIQLTHGLADGKYGLSVDDIVISYYGNRNNSLLENKLSGSMKPMASDEDRAAIVTWVHQGATEAAYEGTGIKQIFEANCIPCHNADSGMPIPDYTDFKNIKERAVVDTGASFQSLARVSHIHLFGIAFIFMFVVFPGKCHFRSFCPENLVLFRRETGLPFVLGFNHFIHYKSFRYIIRLASNKKDGHQ